MLDPFDTDDIVDSSIGHRQRLAQIGALKLKLGGGFWRINIEPDDVQARITHTIREKAATARCVQDTTGGHLGQQFLEYDVVGVFCCVAVYVLLPLIAAHSVTRLL